MSSAAQLAANRKNAQHSTGPKTDAGKQASSQNNFRHGLSGHALVFLEWEHAEHFDALQSALDEEHKPQTPTEQILAEKMAQHYWLSQRAQALQTLEMKSDPFDPEAQKAAANLARYQAHHDRLFQRALHDLLKLRSEKRKAEIGFELQKRAEAQETRREADEKRKIERHSIDMDIRKTRLEREKVRASAAKAASTTPQQLKSEEKPHPVAA